MTPPLTLSPHPLGAVLRGPADLVARVAAAVPLRWATTPDGGAECVACSPVMLREAAELCGVEVRDDA